MFKITLSPQFSGSKLTLIKSGATLTINGETYDFSSLNDGDEVPSDAIDNPFIIGDINRIDDVVNMTIIMPYSDPNADENIAYPKPLLWEGDDSITFNEVQ